MKGATAILLAAGVALGCALPVVRAEDEPSTTQLEQMLRPDYLFPTAGAAEQDVAKQGDSSPQPDLALQPAHVITSPWPRHVPQTTRQGVPGIERTANGRLWAIWVRDAESPRSYVVMATSDDDGHTWSDVKLVIQPRRFVRAMSANLWIDPQGRMWFSWGQSFGQQDGRYGVWAIVTSDPDSENPKWSQPRRIADGIMLNKPTVLASGDWLFPTSIWKAENSCRVIASTDQGQTFKLRGAANIADPAARGPDEPMIVERKDGTLWMLVRTRGIGESVSRDGGRTWSAVEPTSIKHPTARFFIRRLRSGNLLLVKHGSIDKRTRRELLTAYVSTDEGKTWQGGLMLDEREKVTYPDGVQAPDGTIYIIYDYNRTPDGAILMATFREDDVRAGKPVTDKVRLRVEIDRIQKESDK